MLAGTVAQPKHSITSSDIVPSPGSNNTPVATIPVSMVVHGGTGVLNGNMTSLTVNQYIGMVPERARGVWDFTTVREMMADAVKISTDANTQLFHPSDSDRKPALSGNLVSSTTFEWSFPQNDAEAPRIFQRSYWLARPSKGVMTKAVLPLNRVIVCDTQTEECHTQDECVNVVHNQQRYDMASDKLQDISFNFMVGGEGNVYVGRGWDLQGAHTKHNNVGALGVALIGTFSEKPPSKIQLTALSRLINTGIDNHKLVYNYTIVTHCQLRDDGFPGKALAQQLSTWPNFDHSYPISRCI